MLPKINRCLKLVDIEKVSVFEEEIDDLLPNQVLVKIKVAGICGSDLHYFRHGGLGSFKQPLPMDMGHEPSGEVVDSKSKNFKAGDRVALEPSHPHVEDKWYAKGRHNLAEGTFMGADTKGCMADYAVVDEMQCIKIPDYTSFFTASFLEPLAVALHSINLTEVHYTDTVSVFGCGPVGLSVIMCLKKIGIQKIIAVDPIDFRRDKAIELGAEIAYSIDDIVESKLNNLTTVSFDVAGNDVSLDLSIRLCSPGGKLALVGIPEVDHLQVNPHLLRIKELKFINIRRSNQTTHDALELFKKDSKLIDSLITHKFTLDQCQEAFETASNYKNGIIKGVFVDS